MRKLSRLPDGLFGLLDENLVWNILAKIHDRVDRQSWCLVCKRFLEVEAKSRKRIELLRVEVVGKVLQRYPHVEYVDLSPCLEVDDATLAMVGELSGRNLRGISLSRIGRFTEAGLSSLVTRCVGLRELDLSFCCQIDDEGMYVISQFKKLETLTLVNCQHITDVGLGAVARSCTALRNLSLRWCLGVTDTSISQVAAYCKRLESLDLSYTEVTAKGLQGMASLQSLQKLFLVSCNCVDDECLECLRKCSKSLLVLDMARCINVSDRGILALASGPVCLQQICLSYCQPITDGLLAILEKFEFLQVIRLDGCEIAGTELASIGKGCKSLKEFSVSKCTGVTDDGIRAVVESCVKLRELDLTCCRELTDLAIASIGRSCHKLLALKMEACVLVTHKGLADIGLGCTRLELLDLTDCNVDDEGLKGLAGCSALTVLKLGICPKVTDKGITYIAPRCSNLLELDLYRCVAIGDRSVEAVSEFCPKLRFLTLSYCAQVSDFGLFAVSNLHNLTQLDLRALPKVTSSGLAAISYGCKRLLELDIKRCTAIDDVGLLSIASRCSSLRQVNLSFCSITNLGLLAIARLSCMQNMKLMYLDNVTTEGLIEAIYLSGCVKKVKLSVDASLQMRFYEHILGNSKTILNADFDSPPSSW